MTAIAYPPACIQVFRPSIGEEEIDAVADVMRSGWIGNGPKVAEFERQWAAHIRVDPANVVSVGCATEGLYQIMQELTEWYGVDDVIIPDNSFIGTASAILDNGMTAHLCDIDRQTLNPDSDYYYDKLHPHAAILNQSYGGFSPMAYDLVQLADMWDVIIVEDLACHPMASPVGDFAVWSFDAMKVITCGDGGMVYCRSTESAANIRKATRLGMNTASGQLSPSTNWWEFTASVPGRRSMMNDIGAAIGLVQLRRLPEMVAKRQYLWESYQKILDAPMHHWYKLPPEPSEGAPSSYYTYWLSCIDDGVRDRLAHYLREHGIYVTYRYQSISRAYNWDLNMPNSHWANDHVLLLPLHPGLSDNDVSFICETIADFGKTL